MKFFNRQPHAQHADEELMVLVQGMDAEALDAIYQRHATVVFSLAYRMCGVREQAEEVAQDTFLAVWHNANAYAPAKGSVRNWILSIAHNKAIDALRRSSRREGRSASDEVLRYMPSADNTERDALRGEEAGRIQGILQELPNEQRQVIELAYFGGFTHKEMAVMLEVPAGTIKGRMRLGMKKMHKELIGSK
jgi:RNA polymerase sigma-70 factor (ECF subfamily)